VIQPGSVCTSVVSSIDLAPTIIEAAGAKSLASFQGESLLPVFKDPSESVRCYAFAEHNWHDYRAYERGVHDEKFCYVRNWLTTVPPTPPADAVNSPTYRTMQAMRDAGTLNAAQSICFCVPSAGEMLFDVVADPYCLHNLAKDQRHTETLARMSAALQRWQDETGDTFPGEEALTPDGFDRESGKKLIRGSHPDRVRPNHNANVK
jgi:arylsulfatase A-like enzyme